SKKKINIMKKYFTHSILCAALVGGGQFGGLCAEDSAKPSVPMTRQDSVLVTVTASVEAINLPDREITLKGPLGNTETYTVDQKVKRLNEVKVGDLVRVDYYVSIAAELRKPTAAEKKTPIVFLDIKDKAPPGASPAAGGLRRFKVVTTIEGLDRPTQTV